MLKTLAQWVSRRINRGRAAVARAAFETIEPRLLLAGNGLSATYFDNLNFTGAAVTRVDAKVDFNFGTAAPAPGIAANTYSVRWTGQVLASKTESITFHTVSDDGVRLWVNGQKLIDNWSNHPATENKAAISLTAGKSYDIKLEYYNNYGGATARLLWSSASIAKQVIPTAQLFSSAAVPAPAPTPVTPPATGTGNGLAATYYDTISLTGKTVARTDAVVDFNWGTASPATGIPADNFSARWTGQVLATYTQDYTFYTVSDDGVRLFVNGQKLIDNWNPHPATENAGKIRLEAGKKYDIKMEYYERGGGATARLLWSGAGTAKQVVPKSQLFSTAIVQPPADTGPTPVPDPAGTVYNGLLGTYFSTTGFTGSSITRIDPKVSFDWGTGSPQEIIGSDGWSARWQGQILAAKTETYTFHLFSDEGARIWVNGQLILNDWAPHTRREAAGSIALQAGKKYDIKIEYFDAGGDAAMQLRWSSPSTVKQIVPSTSLFCTKPAHAAIPGVPAPVPFTGYKIFGSSQVNFRPANALDKTLLLDGYRLSKLPIDTKGMNIAATATATGAWAYKTITIRNSEISDLYRTSGYHNDFIRIAGVAGKQDTPMNVVLENIKIHDGTAVPILITDGDYDTIVIRNVSITNTSLNQLQINTQMVGSVKRIIVENCPGLGVAIVGKQGTIGECIVRNSPNARVADSLNQQNVKSGVKITILP